ncbi:MAG: hypothetical protein A2017_11760 [Lentisphaerae bacterium GWF2_44_16]|nr:MAG: hypothetical protein A2017_11760 [Lentisphaerae bacterium GWF2_44_16]
MIESRQIRNKSAYETLENELRGMILRSELSYDCAITPETELSSRYGISRNTVRKALANLEKDGLLEKIQGRGTFVVPPEKRPAHAPAKLKILAAITDYCHMSETNVYDRNFISGCLEYSFLAQSEVFFIDPENIIYDDLSEKGIGGIIWERPNKEYYPIIEKLRDEKLPQVTISRSVEGVPGIYFDVERSIEETVEFLVGIGHRDIAFIDLEREYPIFRNRQRVFVDILRRMGHANPEKYLCPLKFGTNYTPKLDMLPPLTAVISSSSIVEHFHSWAERKGFHIPKDISLISLSSENSPELERHPEISAIIDPRREIGKLAMETIEKILRGENISTAPKKIRGELLIRKTCSSPSLMEIHK